MEYMKPTISRVDLVTPKVLGGGPYCFCYDHADKWSWSCGFGKDDCKAAEVGS